MRYTSLLPIVATIAVAFVIPDEATAQQLALEPEAEPPQAPSSSSWWDALPSFDDLRSTAEDTLSSAADALERQASKLSDLLPEVELTTESEYADFLGRGHVGRPGHHGSTNLTVYQAIQASNYTRRFAALVDDYSDLVDVLNSTKANVTAFVPVDKAFERIPDHGKKPPKEFIEKVIEYHIVPGYYPAGRVLAHHTLATALKSEELGDRPQRLRVSLSLFGVRVNFYSKVIMVNLFCKNGIVHGVDKILVPPPPAEKLISLFPSKFSTLELAAEKTGLHHHHESSESHHKTTGLTIFAPTNWAFRKLGPAANAFLFNTDKGLGYLKALLKYHIIVNETLYSDAYYGQEKKDDNDNNKDAELALDVEKDIEGEEEGEVDEQGAKHYHLDLPTLLDDKSLAVDVARWYGFISLTINGHVKVAIQDGVAKDGVVQVVNSVLIPPHKHHQHEDAWKGDESEEISVEELMERLQPFVESEGESVSVVEGVKDKVRETLAWGEL
ncbi:Uu.00g116440.m01.CDS01 [Anthostomella pinea]|uniref:Uu.00g116440.m01.CDS01 n=1 Tax=Anthostomella pinea TaxID=933095 RepID=A0AAI8VG23_9PEZI|nr:Uu.00g116440.m01.CDS01 [Anthostomella pinea]